MKKYLLPLLIAGMLSLTGCDLLSPDTYYIAQGMAAIDAADYAAALENFEAAVAEEQHLVEGYRGQGLAYMGMEDYENAVACFDRAVDLTKEEQADIRKDILMYKATAMYRAEDFEGTVRVCDTIQTLGGSVDAYYLRGVCYMELEQKDKAAVDFDTAVKMAPEDYDLLLNIYECYSSKKLSAEGDGYLQQALSINSQNSEDAFQKARIYYYLGNYDSAKAELNSLVENWDKDAMMLMGRIYMEQEDTAHARELYEQFLKKFGENAEAYNGLVLCDIADGEYSSALEYAAKGLALKGDSGKQDLYFNEIIVYEKMLDFATAKVKAEEYLEKYPTDEAAKKEYEFLKTR